MFSCLEIENEIFEWGAFLEPTNILTAREQTEENTPLDRDKWIIRAALGIDGRRNAARW